jgi:pSer/pThr/pTyr-binding forkhead associated (FHA) protein
VRGALTAAALVDEILREFEGLDRADPAKYALRLAANNPGTTDTSPALAAQRTLAEQGVQSGDRLVFGWAQKAAASARQAVSPVSRAVLQELGGGQIFPITWQPARIGRRDSDAAHNELLLINGEQLTNGGRISRLHAQVTERSGVYFIESLSAKNPTLLNGRQLPAGQPARLTPRDRIELGQSGITLLFIQVQKS